MDTSFSAEDIAFRDEVREFFATEWTEDIIKGLKHPDTFRDTMTVWHKKLYAKVSCAQWICIPSAPAFLATAAASV